MQKAIVKFIVWYLKRNLELNNKSILLTSILKQLQALPLHEIVKYEDGSLIVRGKVLEPEEANLLRTSAKSLLSNRAFGLIQDEVLFESMSGSIASSNIDQLYFFKSASWWGKRENELIKILASDPMNPLE